MAVADVCTLIFWIWSLCNILFLYSSNNYLAFLLHRGIIGQRRQQRRKHMLIWNKLHVVKGRNLLQTHILVLLRRFKLRRGNMFAIASSIPRYVKLWSDRKLREPRRRKDLDGEIHKITMVKVTVYWSLVLFSMWALILMLASKLLNKGFSAIV